MGTSINTFDNCDHIVKASIAAFGSNSFSEIVSEEMGQSSSVQRGQTDGASAPHFSLKIPATNVPCTQAELFF
jgi:hypothetical protein